MRLLPHEPAALDDVRRAHVAAVERAHEHLNRGESAVAVSTGEGEGASTPMDTAASDGTSAHRGRPLGVRNGEGRAPRIVLRKLSLRHKQAISLVLQGMSRSDAAEATGFVPEYITFLLQQPIVKEHIAHVNRTVSTQLEALYGKSVEAIAGGLRAVDPDVKLRAAKLQLQTTGRLEPDETGRKTAEDVVSAILLGVQVNVNAK